MLVKSSFLPANFNNTVESVLEYANANPTQLDVTTQGTLYGAYNAVTGYFQNVKSYKSDEKKLKSIMFVDESQRTQIAFNLCHKYALNAEKSLQMN